MTETGGDRVNSEAEYTITAMNNINLIWTSALDRAEEEDDDDDEKMPLLFLAVYIFPQVGKFTRFQQRKKTESNKRKRRNYVANSNNHDGSNNDDYDDENAFFRIYSFEVHPTEGKENCECTNIGRWIENNSRKKKLKA